MWVTKATTASSSTPTAAGRVCRCLVLCVRRLVWHREEEDPDKEILEISMAHREEQDPDKEILKIVKEKFIFRPGMITDNLDR
jgi:hypothetical protein